MAAAVLVAACAGAAVVPAIVQAQDATGEPVASLSRRQTAPIAYMIPDANGLWQIWTTCPDMARKVQLTSDPVSRNGWPTWSPDGTRIAFNTDRNDPAWSPTAEGMVWDIYTMDRDGGDLVKLTESVGIADSPAYSPDGRLIAFGWDKPGAPGIYVMDAAGGSDVRLVTAMPADATFDGSPRFSPDGSRIVFTRWSGNASAIYVVGLDGSGLTRLTPPSSFPGDADWSPDGTQLVFEADLDAAKRGGPWMMGVDGQGFRSLTGPPTTPGVWDGYSDPVWSPDGSLILVTHGIHPDEGTGTAGLATMRKDGTDIEYLGDGTGGEHQAQWGPPGGC